MNRAVYIIGGGGHGSVVLDALLAAATTVAGILDSTREIGSYNFGVRILGGDEWLDRLAPSEAIFVNGLGANPHVGKRRALFQQLKTRQLDFKTVLHPSVVIGRDCHLEEGCQIMAGSILQCRVRVGINAVINTGAIIEHDCWIGGHAFVAPRAVLCGKVIVADSASGAGATILPAVQIGPGAIVGAGTIVTNNIPAGCIVVGNPAAKLK